MRAIKVVLLGMVMLLLAGCAVNHAANFPYPVPIWECFRDGVEC